MRGTWEELIRRGYMLRAFFNLIRTFLPVVSSTPLRYSQLVGIASGASLDSFLLHDPLSANCSRLFIPSINASVSKDSFLDQKSLTQSRVYKITNQCFKISWNNACYFPEVSDLSLLILSSRLSQSRHWNPWKLIIHDPWSYQQITNAGNFFGCGEHFLF